VQQHQQGKQKKQPPSIAATINRSTRSSRRHIQERLDHIAHGEFRKSTLPPALAAAAAAAAATKHSTILQFHNFAHAPNRAVESLQSIPLRSEHSQKTSLQNHQCGPVLATTAANATRSPVTKKITHITKTADARGGKNPCINMLLSMWLCTSYCPRMPGSSIKHV